MTYIAFIRWLQPRVTQVFLWLLAIVSLSLIVPAPTKALESCSSANFGYSLSGFPSLIREGIDSADNPYTVTVTGLTGDSGEYVLQGRTNNFTRSGYGNEYHFKPGESVTIDDNWYYTYDLWGDELFSGETTRVIELWTPNGNKCDIWFYTLNTERLNIEANLTATQQNDAGEAQSGCFDKSRPIDVTVSQVQQSDGSPYTDDLKLLINAPGGQNEPTFHVSSPSETWSYSVPETDIPADAGGRDLVLKVVVPGHPGAPLDEAIIPIDDSCTDEEREQEFPGVQRFNLCLQIANNTPAGKEQYDACVACVGNEGNAKTWTALGCIDNTAQGIVGKLIGTGVSLAGGIALLMILAAGVELSISQGEPKRVSDAKERLTAAIIGLLFIIFSVMILQFIGVTIFRLPDFGT